MFLSLLGGIALIFMYILSNRSERIFDEGLCNHLAQEPEQTHGEAGTGTCLGVCVWIIDHRVSVGAGDVELDWRLNGD